MASPMTAADVLVATEPRPAVSRWFYIGVAVQFGELRLPSGVERPTVAIVVHRGCWAATLGKYDPRAAGGPDRYRAASPMQLLPCGARIQSFTGRALGEQNTAFDAAAKTSGDPIESTTIPTVGHFVFIDLESDVWPQIVAAVRRLFEVRPARAAR